MGLSFVFYFGNQFATNDSFNDGDCWDGRCRVGTTGTPIVEYSTAENDPRVAQCECVPTKEKPLHLAGSFVRSTMAARGAPCIPLPALRCVERN
jgi:hypothetical protein